MEVHKYMPNRLYFKMFIWDMSKEGAIKQKHRGGGLGDNTHSLHYWLQTFIPGPKLEEPHLPKRCSRRCNLLHFTQGCSDTSQRGVLSLLCRAPGSLVMRVMLPCICLHGSQPCGPHTHWTNEVKPAWHVLDPAPPWNGSWTLTLILALLHLQLHIFQNWIKGIRTLQTKGYN